MPSRYWRNLHAQQLATQEIEFGRVDFVGNSDDTTSHLEVLDRSPGAWEHIHIVHDSVEEAFEGSLQDA